MQEAPKDREILDIFVEILAFGSFKAARVIFKPGIVHNMSESLASDFSQADPCVTINTRSKVRLRIVQVESENLVQSDPGIEFFQR